MSGNLGFGFVHYQLSIDNCIVSINSPRHSMLRA